jgi:hypothetical protein
MSLILIILLVTLVFAVIIKLFPETIVDPIEVFATCKDFLSKFVTDHPVWFVVLVLSGHYVLAPLIVSIDFVAHQFNMTEPKLMFVEQWNTCCIKVGLTSENIKNYSTGFFEFCASNSNINDMFDRFFKSIIKLTTRDDKTCIFD